MPGVYYGPPFVGVDHREGKNDAWLHLVAGRAADLLPGEELLEQEGGLLQRRLVVRLHRGRGQDAVDEGYPVSISDDREDLLSWLQHVLPESEVLQL